MAWHIGGDGFRMRLSNYIPQLVETGLPELMDQLFEQLPQAQSDIKAWAIHPGGRRILEAVQRVCNLQEEALSPSYTILRKHGNMSSPTVLYVLNELLQQPDPAELPREPQMILSAGFGPGLSLEAGLLQYEPN
jgi:predicted naringenin-chalcone synthase